MIYSNLVSSGAFEIYVNNKLVFSKLQSSEMPTADAIIR
jgi:selT/selW/selH-like putative selenoprotein